MPTVTNGMEMITDYVPATYVTHDMLHMRGGHQVQWLIDGVPIPNTNIANNLGPQIDPKDIDYLEVQRGSYDADYGDRTYGIFNVVPRTGFERDRECDLVIAVGNFYQTDNQISCGATHGPLRLLRQPERQPQQLRSSAPDLSGCSRRREWIRRIRVLHLQLRSEKSVSCGRVPEAGLFPDPVRPQSQLNRKSAVGTRAGNTPSYGLRDGEREPDGYATFSWVHTFDPNTLLTVSPFYHYNGADYQGGPNDVPVISSVTQTAQYAGAQVALNANVWRNDIQAGVYGFFQRQYNHFSNNYTVPNSPPNVLSSIGVNGGLAAFFINDKFKVTPWLTLIAGLRETQFNSSPPSAVPSVSEHATDPRLGAAIRIPHLNWTFRGFYGYFYQAPPLSTATNDLQNLAVNQGFGFAPLHGERDIEWQFGATIPLKGWTLDADNFETRAHNWLDHNNVGESNIFWPITWTYAQIQGWELTLRSPNLWHRGQLHLAYANQFAEATSPISGGLICPATMPICSAYPSPGFGPVDHDQREKHVERRL